jgi:RNA-binding protein
MEIIPLTSAQKTRLRGLGQILEASVKLGKAGITPAFTREIVRLLAARELVKLRFEGADRHERAALITQIETISSSVCVGAVGHTALFYLQNPDPEKRVVTV